MPNIKGQERLAVIKVVGVGGGGSSSDGLCRAHPSICAACRAAVVWREVEAMVFCHSGKDRLWPDCEKLVAKSSQ